MKDEAIGLEGYEAALAEDSERLFATVLDDLTELDVRTRVTGGEPPAEALQSLAEVEGADAIVLGSTHRGPLGRIYPGSIAERLLHGAPCAVAVAPRGFASQPEDELRVLCAAFDGSPESRAALEVAAGLAEAAEATLRVVAVHEPFTPGAAAVAPMGTYDVGAVTQREAMQERLDEAVAELPGALRAKGLLLKGQAAEELFAEMELGVDLLVMGSRGRGPLGRVLLGGVSAKSRPQRAVPGAGDAERRGQGAPAGERHGGDRLKRTNRPRRRPLRRSRRPPAPRCTRSGSRSRPLRRSPLGSLITGARRRAYGGRDNGSER